MTRSRRLRPAVLLCVAALAGCADSVSPATSVGAKAVDLPHPMRGLWQGTLVQATPEAKEVPFYGLVAPDGQWLFAALEEAQPTDHDPLETIWGGAPSVEEQGYLFRGEVYDADDQQLSWGATGSFEETASINGEYRVFQGGVGSTAETQRAGNFSVSYNAEYEIDSSVDAIAGDYASDTLSVSISALDEFQAQIGGTGDSRSQLGNCAFTGLIAPYDVRFNAYGGSATLEARCRGAGDDMQFELMAALVYSADCDDQTISNGETNALLLGLRNSAASHYFHRLCRI